MSDTHSPTAQQQSQSNEGVQEASEDKQKPVDATAYKAPYSPHPNNYPNEYIVAFHPSHTMEKHFAFLGRTFEVETLNEGYFGLLAPGLFEAVRRDPGVRFIEDNTFGERC